MGFRDAWNRQNEKSRAKMAEASERRRAAGKELRAALTGDEAAKERVANVRQYVKDHKAERIASVSVNTTTYSLFPDRVIRLPLVGMPMINGTDYDDMMRRIEGVSAKVDEAGSVYSRSTLTRSLVPGMHGWQAKKDDRSQVLVIEGPDFQWVNSIDGGNGLVAKSLRRFAQQVTNAGLGGHARTTQEMW